MRNWAVNCSIMMQGLGVEERLSAVRRAGFTRVEFWWPFATAQPDKTEVDAFVGAIKAADVELIAMNLFAGDMPGGERGVLSLPGREDEFAASVEVAYEIGERLGTQRFNALYGNRLESSDPGTQDAIATANLEAAADRLATIEGTLLIEPVSGVLAYPIRTAADAAAVVGRVNSPSVRVLLDLFHLAQNGDDVPAAIATYGATAGHVQVADAPGRGAPGSGELPLRGWLAQLDAAGYAGEFALEYLDGDEPLAGITTTYLQETL